MDWGGVLLGGEVVVGEGGLGWMATWGRGGS